MEFKNKKAQLKESITPIEERRHLRPQTESTFRMSSEKFLGITFSQKFKLLYWWYYSTILKSVDYSEFLQP